MMIVLVLLPPMSLGFLVALNSVNVPYMDDWGTPVRTLLPLLEGKSLTFQHFIAQANESRPFFPRLIFTGLALVTNWNLRYQMLLSFLIACITALNIFALSIKTVSNDFAQVLSLIFLANLLIFSPLSENWTWGIQTIVFVPIACITGITLIFHSRIKYQYQILLGTMLATISMFSYANGLLAWIVTVPSLLVTTFIYFSGRIKTKILGLALWIGGFILNISLYFYDFKKPEQTPSPLDAWNNPLRALQYFLAFLGAPLGQQKISFSILIGSIFLGLFTLFCTYLLLWGRNRRMIERVTPWLVIAGYSLLSALITTIGRVGFGVEAALSLRYINFSLFLGVSLIYLAAIILKDIARRKWMGIPFRNFIIRFISFGLTVTFLYFSIQSFIHGRNVMKFQNEQRIYGKACLLLVKMHVNQACMQTNIYPSIEYVLDIAPQLNSHNLLTPKLVDNHIFSVAQPNNLKEETYGDLDFLSQPLNLKLSEVITLSGWAILPDRRKKADAVILTYEKSKNDSAPFAIVQVNQARPEISRKLRQSNYQKSGWQYQLSYGQVPAGTKQITAWAFDTNNGKAYKIESLAVQLTTENLTALGEVSPISTIGSIDTVNGSNQAKQIISQNTSFTVSGWAVLSQENRVPDAILFTIGDSDIVVAKIPVNGDRPDVAKHFNNSAFTKSGWTTTISASALKNESNTFKAWAYDNQNKIIYPFATFQLKLEQDNLNNLSSSQLPSDFDGEVYLQLNPDVAEAGVDPKEHYLQYGIKEGRQYKQENP